VDNLIEGTVFLDANFNGQRDASEPGLASVRVLLEMEQDDGTYATVKSQLTAPDGHYIFTSLAPGNYRVRLDDPPEMLQAFPAESAGYSVQLFGSTKAFARDFGLYVSAASAFRDWSLTEAARATIAAQENNAQPEPGEAVDLVFRNVSGFTAGDGAGSGRSGNVGSPEVSENELVCPGTADENSALAASSEADGTGHQAASQGWGGVLARAGALVAALGALVSLHKARGAAHRKDNSAEKDTHLGSRV
jgi:hypothetical protein